AISQRRGSTMQAPLQVNGRRGQKIAEFVESPWDGGELDLFGPGGAQAVQLGRAHPGGHVVIADPRGDNVGVLTREEGGYGGRLIVGRSDGNTGVLIEGGSDLNEGRPAIFVYHGDYQPIFKQP